MAQFVNSKIFRYFLPFITLLVAGSYGLREFTKLRYEYRQSALLEIREELKKQGVQMKDPSEITLESEYEKMKALDIDKWENKRVPRPWEGTEEEN